jgi:tryptophan 7-halogenase
MKNITIVGGGTAGWLTALFLKHHFPKHNITLVESASIGILGAGEGTTPAFVGFLRAIGIDPYDLIVKTKGSIKQGISFENWNGDNKKYFHEFYVQNHLSHFSFEPHFTHTCYHFYIKKLISEKKNLDEYLYPSIISYKNKVDPRSVLFAIHFDAVVLADYLKDIGIQRGIKRVEGIVEDVSLNKKGFISEVILKNKKIKTDFVFDCSGFKRAILGKKLNTKWISYEKWLPMDSAIAFPMKPDKKVMPYTQAIAMKNGWIWRIPLQHRYGAGYIFDSNYTNETEALKEAEKYFKKKLKVVNRFKFSPGRFENVWVKNCIAIGLSSGFTEPLEATSIWLSVTHLETLRHYFSAMEDNNEDLIKNYNKLAAANNDNVKDFIFYHYLSKRNDSTFWKSFRKDRHHLYKEIPFLNNFIHNKATVYDFSFQYGPVGFGIESFHQVGHGLGLLNIHKENWFKNQKPTIEEYFNTIKVNEEKNSFDHRDFLNRLNNGIRI